MEKWIRYLPALGTALVVAVLLAILYVKGAPLDWSSAVALLLIAIFGFAVAATLRFAVGQLFAPVTMPANADGDTLLRSRLAPLVIGIGTAGILVVAVAVLIGIGLGTEEAPDASVYVGIFSSVVPVFATWVGAVIAFYFSNESFRQAAQASGALKADPSADEPINSPTRMIPVDKITAIVLGGPKKEQGSAPSSVTDLALEGSAGSAFAATYPTDPNEIAMADVLPMFNNTVSRVIVFDANMRPKLILRSKLVPAERKDGTVRGYLEHEQNASDAVNFKTVPETATVGEARAMMKLFKLADLFVSKTGGTDEPIKGWVPDDKLA